MAKSLDSLLEKALAESEIRSACDVITVALHAKLLAEGFECVALGDEVSTLDGGYVITCTRSERKRKVHKQDSDGIRWKTITAKS